MVFVAVLGVCGWINPPLAAATASGRLLAPSNTARWLGAMLLGMLLAWDIPASLLIPRLRKPDTLIHHIAMAAVALVGCTYLPTHYGLYYMGVVELSSIPLTFYDQCDAAVVLAGKDEHYPKARAERLRQLRDGSKAVAVTSFVLVRAVDFTRVTLAKFVPDALAVLASPATAAGFRLPIQFMLCSSVGFVALQLYWLSIMVRILRAQGRRQKKRRGGKGGD